MRWLPPRNLAAADRALVVALVQPQFFWKDVIAWNKILTSLGTGDRDGETGRRGGAQRHLSVIRNFD